jgi:hypothetical protein
MATLESDDAWSGGRALDAILRVGVGQLTTVWLLVQGIFDPRSLVQALRQIGPEASDDGRGRQDRSA